MASDPSEIRIGVDLGGTKIEALAMDHSGHELLRRRQPTPKGDYPATIDVIRGLVEELEAKTGRHASGVGVGIPGSLSPVTGLVRNSNTTWINGKPFDQDLRDALDRSVVVANDGNCLALSEALDGAAAGARSVVAVILGTGFGGGIVIDGKIVSGANGIGGELGHFPHPLAPGDTPVTEACWCGRAGCNEMYLTGPALARDYARECGCSEHNRIDVRDIHARAESGETAARKVLERHLERLARTLALIVNIIDPEVFVLGGGVSNLPHLVRDLPAKISPHVFADPADRTDIRIIRAKHGDSSGVRGAARLCEA